MDTRRSVIEDWDGDGAIRLPDEALQELGVDAGTTRCLVLSRTPKLPDRLDELVEQWDRTEKDDRNE